MWNRARSIKMKVDEKVNQYIATRAVLDAERKKFKDIERELKADMAEVELELLETAKDLGVNSFSTNNGTAYVVVKKYASLNDRETLINYVKATGDFGLFTSHINKLHLIELMDDRIEPMDIGIAYSEETALNFRKN